MKIQKPFRVRRRTEKLQLRFKIAVFYIFIFFALFSFARFLLFSFNYSFFQELSFWQTLLAFIKGLKFDFAALSLCFLPSVLFMILPMKSIKWLKGWSFILSLEFILYAAMLSADLISFTKLQHHIGGDLMTFGKEVASISNYFFGSGVWLLVLFVLAFLFIAWLMNEIIKIFYEEPAFRGAKEITVYILLLLLTLCGLYANKINTADSCNNTPVTPLENLALNGIFTSHKAIKLGSCIAENSKEENLALDETAQVLSGDRTLSPKPYQYPVMRTFKETKGYKKNLNTVLVILKSWTPKYIDELSLSENKYGVTPNFDRLIRKGAYYKDFYAFGDNPVPAVTAVLTGIPELPNLPKLGAGLENISMTKLPQILKEQDYRTIFAQAVPRASSTFDKSAAKLGFSEVYSKEDMPKQFNYAQADGLGYDYDMYNLLLEKLRGEEKPFFLTAVAGITQAPYLGYLENFDKYPNTTEENKYLNSLFYADYSLGYFIDEMRKEPWFYDTVFIFVSDNTFNPGKDIKEKYNIPFLIYAPRYIKAEKNETLGSQLDLLPTLFDLLRLKEPYSAAGKSLFESGSRQALFAEDYTIGLITPTGALTHTRQKPLEVQPSLEDFNKEQAEELLLSLDKVFYNLIKQNRWYPAQENIKNDK